MNSVVKRFTKIFFGLMGFSAVVALSFLIVSGVEKSFFFLEEEVYAAVEYTPQNISQVPPSQPPMLVPPPPQPPIIDEHLPLIDEPIPRIVMLEAEESYVHRGYNYTVFVEFNEQRLSFHIAEDANVDYAILTISHAVDLFDLAHEHFPGLPSSTYFIGGQQSSVLHQQIYHNIADEPINGFFTYLYFSQSNMYPLPWWLCIGLEAYLLDCDDVNFLGNVELAAALQTGAGVSPFGDAWFVSYLTPRGPSEDVRDIAYSIVRSWSGANTLYDLIRLAQSDTHAFAIRFNEYIAGLTNTTNLPSFQLLYQFGDFNIITQQASYVFISDNYDWSWPRVDSFILYMDSAIKFVRDYFHITNSDRFQVTLYPFGVLNVPSSIAELAYLFGWDAPDVNFVTNDEIMLASTSRFGTWAIPHEAAHILLFREFPGYRPATWMVEGIAVLGELLFRDAFDGPRNYRFSVPTLANINTLARNSAGHILPFLDGEDTFGRDIWTYDEAGSFVLYLYNNFGIEALLEMYRSDNYNQFERALDIFGIELNDLIKSWRGFLWPNGEPEGWW